MKVWLVGGSRVLPAPALLLIAEVCEALASHPFTHVVVGDAVGADYAALTGLLRRGIAPTVYCAGTAPRRVRALNVPCVEVRMKLPYRQLLAVRSKAAAARATAGVFVLSHADSIGSLHTIEELARQGKSSRVFTTFHSDLLPALKYGEWERMSPVCSFYRAKGG
jgi:hypothetical protein